MTIKELRMSRNMTQSELATQIGVKRTTIAMWESGSSLPRTDKLPELARIFGCTIDDLFKKGE